MTAPKLLAWRMYGTWIVRIGTRHGYGRTLGEAALAAIFNKLQHT